MKKEEFKKMHNNYFLAYKEYHNYLDQCFDSYVNGVLIHTASKEFEIGKIVELENIYIDLKKKWLDVVYSHEELTD